MLWKLILKMSQVFQILADIFGPNTPKGLWSGIQEKSVQQICITVWI